MNYSNFRYLFPPRPKNAVPDTDLDSWDNDTLLAQPKINGSNCIIFTNGERLIVMNRHGQYLTNFLIPSEEIYKLFKLDIGKWLVLNGEYLNKSKQDENSLLFNHKLVIFDILVYNSEYLIGKSFIERVELLDSIYGTVDSDKKYLYSISDNIYRVKTYQKDFKLIFDNLTKIDMIEGLVLKRKSAKLEIGITENNNSKSQFKSRKVTKNYRY